jgi:hypothetical protein
MPASTPLDKIDTDNAPDNQASDEDRVQRIIQEMNGGSDREPPGRGEEQEHPSQQMPPSQTLQYMQQGGPPMHPPNFPQMPPHMYAQMMQQQQQQMHEPRHEREPEPEPEKHVEEPVKKNIWAHITDILKLPFVVTIVFFLLSLPIVDTYIAKYAGWAFSSSGTLTLYGIAAKAVSAGAIMGVYDTLDKVISRFF